MRSAEWSGFYPSDVNVTPDPVTDDYRSMIEQLFPRRKELLELVNATRP